MNSPSKVKARILVLGVMKKRFTAVKKSCPLLVHRYGQD